MDEDRCVCCGAVIPEGRMVCPNCLVDVKKEKTMDKIEKNIIAAIVLSTASMIITMIALAVKLINR